METIPLQSISRSYSRKIQVKQFEPIETSAHRSVQVPADISAEEIKKISAKLFKECVDEVEADLEERKKDLISQPPF